MPSEPWIIEVIDKTPSEDGDEGGEGGEDNRDSGGSGASETSRFFVAFDGAAHAVASEADGIKLIQQLALFNSPPARKTIVRTRVWRS